MADKLLAFPTNHLGSRRVDECYVSCAIYAVDAFSGRLQYLLVLTSRPFERLLRADALGDVVQKAIKNDAAIYFAKFGH